MLLGWGSAARGWGGCGGEEPPQPVGLPAGPPVPPPAAASEPPAKRPEPRRLLGDLGDLGEPKALKIRYLRHTGDIFF